MGWGMKQAKPSESDMEHVKALAQDDASIARVVWTCEMFMRHVGNPNVSYVDLSDGWKMKDIAGQSYTMHCGARAVACAEADLLGKALEVCRMATEGPYLTINLEDAARDVLAMCDATKKQEPPHAD